MRNTGKAKPDPLKPETKQLSILSKANNSFAD